MKSKIGALFFIFLLNVLFAGNIFGSDQETAGVEKECIFPVDIMKPVEKNTYLKPGDEAPDFMLPSIDKTYVSLSDYKGKKNVVISFVPAAWTPVCSGQWPTYAIAKDLFDKHDAILLGITEDNIPSLYAWVHQMNDIWFPVLSDFWPHGKVASLYGVFRSSGTSERALFIIDKQGIIRYVDVHDINNMPDFEVLATELEKLKNPQQ